MIVSKWSIKLFIGWNPCHQLLLKIIESIDIIYLNKSFMGLWTDFYRAVKPIDGKVWFVQLWKILSVDPFPESIKTHMLIDQAQSMSE